jgi:hypothetical protein
LDISNARNSVVVNHVSLKFYTSIFGAIIKSLLAKKGIFSMMNFRHSSTLTFVCIKIHLFINICKRSVLYSLFFSRGTIMRNAIVHPKITLNSTTQLA